MGKTYKERYVTGMVLDAIARLLPFCPRDFTVDITQKPDGKMGINVEAKTEIGAAVKPILVRELNAELKKAWQMRGNDEGHGDTDSGASAPGAAGHLDEESDVGRSAGSDRSDPSGRDV